MLNTIINFLTGLFSADYSKLRLVPNRSSSQQSTGLLVQYFNMLHALPTTQPTVLKHQICQISIRNTQHTNTPLTPSD